MCCGVGRSRLAFFATDRGVFTGGGAQGVKLLAVQAVIALASVLVSGVLTFLIAVVIKKTIGWRITEQEEFEGIDYSIHRETGYDVGGPGHHRHRGPGPWSAAGER